MQCYYNFYPSEESIYIKREQVIKLKREGLGCRRVIFNLSRLMGPFEIFLLHATESIYTPQHYKITSI